MFPSAYFGDRYFAPRYWAKVGQDQSLLPATGDSLIHAPKRQRKATVAYRKRLVQVTRNER